METQTAGIGHNNPPDEIDTLRSRLDSDTEPLRERQKALLAAFDRAPIVISNDEELKNSADFVAQIHSAIKLSESLHKGLKEPYLSGGRVVDGYFRPIKEPLENAKKAMERRIAQRLQQKQREEQERLEHDRRMAAEAAAKAAEEAPGTPEAEHAAAVSEAIGNAELERQQARGDMATMSLRIVKEFKIVDLKSVDLELLRSYIPIAALETAIRGAMRAGHTKITGVEIFETQKARL